MSHQNDMLERAALKAAAQRQLNELVRHVPLGSAGERVDRRMAAGPDTESIEIERGIACTVHCADVGVALRAVRKVPVDMAIGCAMEEYLERAAAPGRPT